MVKGHNCLDYIYFKHNSFVLKNYVIESVINSVYISTCNCSKDQEEKGL